MGKLILLLILSSPALAQSVYAGFAGETSVGIGVKYPQAGGAFSVEWKRVQFRSDVLSVTKVSGGSGVGGINSATVFIRKFGFGARHSWIVVDYKKQVVRPFVAFGSPDLNVKYVHRGSDVYNALHAAMVEYRRPTGKWRFGIEGGLTWFHGTYQPDQRHMGVVIGVRVERLIRRG